MKTVFTYFSFLLIILLLPEINCNAQQHFIGQKYGGGIVFSLDGTGEHGLIAAPFDQPNFTCWGKDGWTNANLMNEGESNTEKIVSIMKNKHFLEWQGVPAACMCDTLKLEGYDDWYLPSINELKDMFDRQKVIGNFVAGDYCSSTEMDRSKCWNIHFGPNKKIIFKDQKIWVHYFVRCIRKF